MIVVADSSPVICLVNIGLERLLPDLFAEVLIPPEVESELQFKSRPQAVRDFISHRPGWLHVVKPLRLEPISSLHPGEVAAISLASERKADLLLIDERVGRAAAIARNIPIAGTIGVLTIAAEQSLIDLADAFERVKKQISGFLTNVSTRS